MRLKIKKDYANCEIRRGNLLFVAGKTPEQHYQFYFDNGFDDIFEVLKPKTIEEITQEVEKYTKDEKEKQHKTKRKTKKIR